MNEKTRASRGATAGLSNAFLAVGGEKHTAALPERQASKIAKQFGLSPTLARVIAFHAFDATPEHWRRA